MFSKIEVPAELRALAEKSIDHVEQAFGLFFAAAARPLQGMPNQAQLLSLSRENLRATLNCARSLAGTTESQEIMRAHAEHLKQLLANAQQQLQQMSEDRRTPTDGNQGGNS